MCKRERERKRDGGSERGYLNHFGSLETPNKLNSKEYKSLNFTFCIERICLKQVSLSSSRCLFFFFCMIALAKQPIILDKCFLEQAKNPLFHSREGRIRRPVHPSPTHKAVNHTLLIDYFLGLLSTEETNVHHLASTEERATRFRRHSKNPDLRGSQSLSGNETITERNTVGTVLFPNIVHVTGTVPSIVRLRKAHRCFLDTLCYVSFILCLSLEWTLA